MATEKKRGCGYRKIGGLYLCSDGIGENCHRLPFALDVCPTCHGGIKQARGWTWLDWTALAGVICDRSENHCHRCIVCRPALLNGAKVGLIWIGEQFYKTPGAFTAEAAEMGVSRRISAIPKGFKVGEHFVMVAHPKAVKDAHFDPDDDSMIDGPGIFHVFRPTRIEKILPDNTTDEEVQKWEARGCTVVKLPANDRDHQGSVFDKSDDQPELPC